jgi:hypothetical protein
MRIYLASPAQQVQAHAANGMPVLLSFAKYTPFLDKYQQTYPHILIDSGAFAELNSGHKIDGVKYKEWQRQWGHADAIAGLDDISGNTARSLENYTRYGGFPTMHDTDPKSVLPELIDISREQGGNWLGIGLKPPREGKQDFIRWVLDNTPDDIHIHGWALRQYMHLSRLDSVDSTNWWRDAMDLRVIPLCKHLSYGECLDITVKRYQRESRMIQKPQPVTAQLTFI